MEVSAHVSGNIVDSTVDRRALSLTMMRVIAPVIAVVIAPMRLQQSSVRQHAGKVPLLNSQNENTVYNHTCQKPFTGLHGCKTVTLYTVMAVEPAHLSSLLNYKK